MTAPPPRILSSVMGSFLLLLLLLGTLPVVVAQAASSSSVRVLDDSNRLRLDLPPFSIWWEDQLQESDVEPIRRALQPLVEDGLAEFVHDKAPPDSAFDVSVDLHLRLVHKQPQQQQKTTTRVHRRRLKWGHHNSTIDGGGIVTITPASSSSVLDLPTLGNEQLARTLLHVFTTIHTIPRDGSTQEVWTTSGFMVLEGEVTRSERRRPSWMGWWTVGGGVLALVLALVVVRRRRQKHVALNDSSQTQPQPQRRFNSSHVYTAPPAWEATGEIAMVEMAALPPHHEELATAAADIAIVDEEGHFVQQN